MYTDHMITKFPVGGECISSDGLCALAVGAHKNLWFHTMHADAVRFLCVSKKLGIGDEIKVLANWYQAAIWFQM
jgi:hypothetical protein